VPVIGGVPVITVEEEMGDSDAGTRALAEREAGLAAVSLEAAWAGRSSPRVAIMARKKREQRTMM